MALAQLAAEIRQELLDRLDFLGFIPERVLDLNAGAGASVVLKRRFPRALVCALAETDAELAAARRRWYRTIYCVRARRTQLPIAAAAVDLLFLCLPGGAAEQTASVLAEARRVLRPRGYLSVAVYGAGTLGELRAARASVEPAPPPIALLDGPTLVGMLQAAGFVDVVLDVDRHRLSYPSLRALSRDTRALRAPRGGLALVRARALRSALASALAPGADASWSISIEVLYAQGFCPTGEPPQRWQRGDTVVPLSQLGRR